jgi:putative pyruvate formate lyase activating enzyme
MPPSYLKLYESGELKKRVEKLFSLLESCRLCPRECKINRLRNEKGFCQAGVMPKIYAFHLHHGEEPPISGSRGSGTIFFTHCNSRCLYCQNYIFSQLARGREFTFEELAKVMLDLQRQGAHNINLVTPTHFIAQIITALQLAVSYGLKIPIVYNTMAYDSQEVLALLEGIVDIYLPDIRYGDNLAAEKYSSLPDYVKINQACIKEMYRQVGNLILENGVAERGLIVRHLVLPNQLSQTRKVMEFLAKEISPDVAISLMSQYYPTYKAQTQPPLSRPINHEEWQQAVAAMAEFGLHNGWIQDQPTALDREKFFGVNFEQS